MKNNNIQYLNGLVCDKIGRAFGLSYTPDVNFIQTLTKSDSNTTVTMEDVRRALPVNVIHVRSDHNGSNGATVLQTYTIVNISLRGSEPDNPLHYDYHTEDSSRNRKEFSSPSMLMSMQQVLDLNATAVTKMYNKVIDERDTLKIENDFTVKLFKNIKINKDSE